MIDPLIPFYSQDYSHLFLASQVPTSTPFFICFSMIQPPRTSNNNGQQSVYAKLQDNLHYSAFFSFAVATCPNGPLANYQPLFYGFHF